MTVNLLKLLKRPANLPGTQQLKAQPGGSCITTSPDGLLSARCFQNAYTFVDMAWSDQAYSSFLYLPLKSSFTSLFLNFTILCDQMISQACLQQYGIRNCTKLLLSNTLLPPTAPLALPAFPSEGAPLTTPSSSSMTIGAAVGGAVGGLLLIAVLATGVVLYCRRRGVNLRASDKPSFISSSQSANIMIQLEASPCNSDLPKGTQSSKGQSKEDSSRRTTNVTSPQSLLASHSLPWGDEALEVFEELGRGGFGVVYRGLWKGLPVAAKMMIVHEDHHEQARRQMMEATMSTGLSHPNIVTTYMFDMKRLADDGDPATEARLRRNPLLVKTWQLTILQELCIGGSLRTLMTGKMLALHAACAETLMVHVLQISLDVALGLEHLHSKNVVHMDLTPDNVLLQATGAVTRVAGLRWIAKVADFGLSIAFEDGRSHQSQVYVGTPHYIAPETQGSGLVSKQSDIFTLGVVLHELVHATGLAMFAPPACCSPVESFDFTYGSQTGHSVGGNGGGGGLPPAGGGLAGGGMEDSSFRTRPALAGVLSIPKQYSPSTSSSLGRDSGAVGGTLPVGGTLGDAALCGTSSGVGESSRDGAAAAAMLPPHAAAADVATAIVTFNIADAAFQNTSTSSTMAASSSAIFPVRPAMLSLIGGHPDFDDHHMSSGPNFSYHDLRGPPSSPFARNLSSQAFQPPPTPTFAGDLSSQAFQPPPLPTDSGEGGPLPLGAALPTQQPTPSVLPADVLPASVLPVPPVGHHQDPPQAVLGNVRTLANPPVRLATAGDAAAAAATPDPAAVDDSSFDATTFERPHTTAKHTTAQNTTAQHTPAAPPTSPTSLPTFAHDARHDLAAASSLSPPPHSSLPAFALRFPSSSSITCTTSCSSGGGGSSKRLLRFTADAIETRDGGQARTDRGQISDAAQAPRYPLLGGGRGRHGPATVLPPLPPTCSPAHQQLIAECLSQMPRGRPAISDVRARLAALLETHLQALAAKFTGQAR